MPHPALPAALRGATLSAVACAAFAFAAPAQAQQVIGLTTTNALISFGAATPQNGSALTTITGLEGTNQRILAIDTRPTNGLIYGVSTDSKLYTLDAATGVATKVGNLSIALNGTAFGFDFNPMSDRIRVVSDAGQNLRGNHNGGVIRFVTERKISLRVNLKAAKSSRLTISSKLLRLAEIVDY